MKTKYEMYKMGSDVWGVSEYFHSKGTHHYAVYPARVIGAYATLNKKTGKMEHSYELETPKGQTWGDNIPGEFVSDSFEEIIEKLKKIWLKHSEWTDE